jgi:hypothetical protein
MKRFYFDICDGDRNLIDEEGLDLPDIKTAEHEATLALAEMAHSLVRGRKQRNLTIAVRDDDGPLLRASFSFLVQPAN